MSLWHAWKSPLAALLVCLGGFLLNVRARPVGYAADALGLLGCHFLRLILLLLAWAIVATAFKAGAREKPTGVTVLDLAGGFSHQDRRGFATSDVAPQRS